MLFSYQGYVQAALVLGGVDVTGPHLHTVKYFSASYICTWLRFFVLKLWLSILHHVAVWQIYPHGSTDTLPFATMGSGSLAAMSVFESKYKEGMNVS